MPKIDSTKFPELVCPASNLSALKTAVKYGANAVYCGLKGKTNARNFPALNFTYDELTTGIAFAKKNNAKVYVAINSFPAADSSESWHEAVDSAVDAKADALIVADFGLAKYIANKYPANKIHFSVQTSLSSSAAIKFAMNEFGIKRVVLPRVLTIDEIKRIIDETSIETEVFVFGGLCIMAEGRCFLSSYVTGVSPNRQGTCSPAHMVSYQKNSKTIETYLNNRLIDKISEQEKAGYPTLCKALYSTENEERHVFSERQSLSAANLLSEFMKIGVTAFKIEGRQRGRAYIKATAQAFRTAIDNQQKPNLSIFAEGNKTTTGSYEKAFCNLCHHGDKC